MSTGKKGKETNLFSFEYNNVTVKFPFPPYEIQKDYMRMVIDSIQNNKNAMLESPTGTGKTLSLLCSALAAMDFTLRSHIPKQYSDHCKSIEATNHSGDKGQKLSFRRIKPIPIAEVAGRKLIYCSRTHSQIKQIVRELKKTVYRPKTMVMASRDQMCINSEVKNLPQYAQRTTCHFLGLSCMFHRNVNGDIISNLYGNKTNPDRGIMDIEDLFSFGMRRNVCPYYLARHEVTMIESQLLLMPYNYIMDYHIRSRLNLDLQECVVIIDEAHNIDSFCLTSLSYDINARLLHQIENEIKELLSRNVALQESKLSSLDEREQQEMQRNLEENYVVILAVIQRIEEVISKRLNTNTGNVISASGSSIYELLAECGIDRNSLPMIDQLIQEVILLRQQYFPHAKGCSTETLQQFLSIIFRDGSQLPRSMADKWMVVLYSDEETVYDRVTKRRHVEKYPCLGFWCMDCSLAMQMLSSTGISSIIFTSGTLSPMNPLISEFQIPVTNTLENMHVISNSQLLVATVDRSIHNIQLSSSFQSRQNPVLKEEMIDTILFFLPAIPGNVIIFFPSYSYLNECFTSWEQQGKINTMRSMKEVYREESRMNNAQFGDIVKHLQKAVYERGAILLAVCRGKASEGIDFSDAMCRCVIITGIPYPTLTDLKVKMRRKYLDDRSAQQHTLNKRVQLAASRGENIEERIGYDLPLASLACLNSEDFTGNDWYTISAHRAVNQSIGRVIRHKDDFGVILLMDERFGSADSRRYLSRWMQPFYRSMKTCADLLSDIEQFFFANSRGYVLPPKPKVTEQRSDELKTLDQKLNVSQEESSKQKVKPKVSLKTGLFGKIHSVKQKSESQSLSRSQSLTKEQEEKLKQEEENKKQQEEEAKKREDRRKLFFSRLKPSQEEAETSTKPMEKGIKRFFHKSSSDSSAKRSYV